MTKDRGLLELFLNRDENAVAAAEKKYGAYCFSVALRILGDRLDAEECVSETWMKAWELVPETRPESLKYYLAKITRNLAVNRLLAKRRRKRIQGTALVVLTELAECLPDPKDPMNEIEAEELKRSVCGFVAALPAREGDIFIRRCFYMESMTEIAKQYGLSVNHAAVILSRTRKKLRKHLIEEEFLIE